MNTTFHTTPRSYTRPHLVGWAVASLAVTAVLVLAVLPPFVGEGGRYVLMEGFAAVCHQMPSRSFHLHGMPLAVCHRCLGIYGGMALGAWALLPLHAWLRGQSVRLTRYTAYLLIGALAVPGIDWLGDVLGLWINTPASRLVTGSIFGLVAGGLLAYAVLRDRTREPARTAATRGTA